MTDIPKGYKLTEVGVIPEEWEVKTVSQVGKVVTGGTPSTANPVFWTGTIPWITPTDISWRRDILESERLLTEAGLQAIRYLPANSVLVTCIASIGKNAILRAIGGCNQQINAIIPNSSNDVDFLYYLFESSKSYLLANAGTTATSIVSKAAFERLCYALPPLSEQRAIAAALSDVDALLAGLDRLIAKKRDLKQAAMQQLLTGQTRLPGFHGEWDASPFDTVFRKINAKAFQIQTADYHASGSFPVIDQGHIAIVGYSDQADKVFCPPDEGVIVFGDHTCIVKFVNFEFIVGADGTQILATKQGHNARFQAFQLQYCGIEPTGYNRHFKFLKERAYMTPPHAEQAAIASVLSDMDAEIDVLERRRAKTADMKQGMMQELLTGRTRLV